MRDNLPDLTTDFNERTPQKIKRREAPGLGAPASRRQVTGADLLAGGTPAFPGGKQILRVLFPANRFNCSA